MFTSNIFSALSNSIFQTFKLFQSFLQVFLQGFHRDMGSVIPETLPTSSEKTFDAKKIEAIYKKEREKRIREDGPTQFLQAVGKYSHFKEDPWAVPFVRDPIEQETKVAIVGAGFGGLVAGVKLRDQGVNDFLILEKGGGYGGTWYWNRYPGISLPDITLEKMNFMDNS